MKEVKYLLGGVYGEKCSGLHFLFYRGYLFGDPPKVN
jgi:hypothetical protein